MYLSRIRRVALAAPALALVIQLGTPAQAQPRRGAPLKHAEAILGKPLTEAQKTAIKAAAEKRQKKIKPIQDEFKASVAKALGLTPAQYKQREDKLKEQGKKD